MGVARPGRQVLGGTLAAVTAVALLVPSARGQAAPPRDELDVTTYEVVYQVPGMSRVSVQADVPFKDVPGGALRLDVYRPPDVGRDARVPAVVFVNGVGLPALKEWQIYRSWARLVAASGFAAITFESRRAQVHDDVRDLFGHLRAHAGDLGIDPDRVAVWSCSGNTGPALAYVTSASGAWLKAVVAYYGWVEESDVALIRGDQPFFVVRAGRDNPELNLRLAALADRAVGANAPWTVINAPRLTHAFDALDDGPESRQVVRDTLTFLDRQLRPEPLASPPISAAHRALNHVYGHELSEAVEAYGELLKERPGDAALHARVGGLDLQLRRFPEAAASFEKAISLGDPGWRSFYNLACARALGGEPEKALAALEKAVSSGFGDATALESDADLASLHADPRFAALLRKLRP
jgi:acetyl esterase/lipase